MNAHLRRFSTQTAHNPSSEAQVAEALPPQQANPLACSPDNNGVDAASQEGLLGIIMDVCKLHVNDAIHDIQRPADPARRSTFGTIPIRERQPSYLDLDSEAEDEFSETLASQCSNTGAGDEEKMRPLPLQTRQLIQTRQLRRSEEINDQWSNEKEQAKIHLTEIIRSHVSRHIYLIRLFRALMLYGAPTHRLQE